MSILQFCLFGKMRVTSNDWQTEIKMTREIQTLLAFLLLERHKVHPRQVLAELLWGEYGEKRARGSLNTALWKLGKAIETDETPAGTYLKKPCRDEVCFNNESEYWLDIEEFEEKVTFVLTFPFHLVERAKVIHLEGALRLYKGELLEGVYTDWVISERERLCTLYIKGLIYLLQYYGYHKEHEKAIAYGQRALTLDPLQEEIHRLIMEFYLEDGQRVLAARQYEICCTVLAKELGVSPMLQTQMLYAQVLKQDKMSNTATLINEQIGLDQALIELRQAYSAIELVKEKIEHVQQFIEKYSEHSHQIP